MRTNKFLQVLVALVIAAFVLSACGSAATPASAPATQAPVATQPAAATVAPVAPTASVMDTLAVACKKEGALNLIADPRDWANYGELMDEFGNRYDVSITDNNPLGTSAQELQAIQANEGNNGPQAPDTVDVGYAFGPQGVSQGLFQPYKVQGWDDISLKDPDGYWYEGYYGVIVLQVNTKVVTDVPQDWSDLLKPEYKGMIALGGIPTGSSEAMIGVWAAGLSKGGSLDNAQPGLDFFAALNKAGNFVPVNGTAASFGQGETPIILRWDYLALGDRDTLAGNPPVQVVVPKSGTIGGPYVQAISKYAPHPNCAKLWMEFLYSDEGQLEWLKGYVHPARFQSLVDHNIVPADVLSSLPSASAYTAAVIPTLDQETAAFKLISTGWDSQVGVTVH